MKLERSSGILLHPTSLPGPYGIGDLGSYAYHFVDWLASAGCKLWQILPLGPTGYGDSPYQCFSAFAGNPYLINPDLLLHEGLLHPDDLVEKVNFQDHQVDFGRIIPWKLNLLERAFMRFKSTPGAIQREFDRFAEKNSAWLHDYALFMAIKEAHGGGAWGGWPPELRGREKIAIEEAEKSLSDAISRYTFYQFIFFRQWNTLRDYAREKDIKIIGDIPIFVAYDSADVWGNPELFALDDFGQPTVVAGVPPDYFSPTGQLWGNPLYRWNIHRENGYAWWLARFRAILGQVDIVRLDHFRGFAGYWEIPGDSPTAETGRWVPGPGKDFLSKVETELGELPIIAEDLGEITPDVIELRDHFNLPGMKIIQFGFSGPENPFLPHNYPETCVTYTGTHDNDTSRGWYETAPTHERNYARRFLNSDGSGFPWDLIRAAWSSVAVYALAPMQDILSLGTDARMNFPGTLGNNWCWRMSPEALSDRLKERLRDLNYLYRR